VQSVSPAGVQTVEAIYTAAVIYGFLLAADTRSLTLHFTRPATVAFAFVYPDPENGKPAQKTQNSTYRTNRIAVRTPVFPSQIADNAQRQYRYCKSEYAHYEYIHPVEGIISESGENHFQNVVACQIYRTENVRNYPSISAVRINKTHYQWESQ
jgi:hypothetical protein